jgi:hypothetical protein
MAMLPFIFLLIKCRHAKDDYVSDQETQQKANRDPDELGYGRWLLRLPVFELGRVVGVFLHAASLTDGKKKSSWPWYSPRGSVALLRTAEPQQVEDCLPDVFPVQFRFLRNMVHQDRLGRIAIHLHR